MELVIVLPVYLVLFGGVFMLGDTLIRSIRLPSAERTQIFDYGRSDGKKPGWNVVESDLFHPDREVDDEGSPTDVLNEGEPRAKYVDTAIEGPFSVLMASNVGDEYSLLAGGSRGQLAFASLFFRKTLTAVPDPLDGKPGNDVQSLSRGGRLQMRSKPDVKSDGTARARAYNSYVLKRHRYGEGEWMWRDNRRHAHELLIKSSKGLRVWDAVYQEEWLASVSDDPTGGQYVKPADADPDQIAYGRFKPYDNWTNNDN